MTSQNQPPKVHTFTRAQLLPAAQLFLLYHRLYSKVRKDTAQIRALMSLFYDFSLILQGKEEITVEEPAD